MSEEQLGRQVDHEYRELMENYGPAFIMFERESGRLLESSSGGPETFGLKSVNPVPEDYSILEELAAARIVSAGIEFFSLNEFLSATDSFELGDYIHLQIHPEADQQRVYCHRGAGVVSLIKPRGESTHFYRSNNDDDQLIRAIGESGIGYFRWIPATGELQCSASINVLRGSRHPIRNIGDLMETVHPEDRKRVWDHLHDETLTNFEQSLEISYRVRGSDPAFPWKWIKETRWQYYSKKRAVRSIFAINLDITETIEREEELKRARDIAEESSRSKNEFLSNMSHEIRTPLNAILGFSQIIASETPGDQTTQYARTIRSSGKQLLSMLDSILTLAKIEAGHLHVVEDEFSLYAMMRELESNFIPKAQKKHLELSMYLDPATPDYLISDREKIFALLQKLMDNAVKFTNQGYISVLCNFRPEGGGEQRGTLEIVVEDTGIGMRPENLESMQSLFTQAEQNNSRKYGGSGLGLTLTSRMLKLLNGSIVLSPRNVRGTKLTVRIPVRRSETSQTITPNFTEITRAKKILKGKIILSVDDSDSNRILMREMLKELEISFHSAPSGTDAIKQFGKLMPDILLMDINMPEMDGWESLAHIQKNYPEQYERCRILMLTGDEPDLYPEQREKFRVSGFLTKPFSRQKLYSRISSLFPEYKDTDEDPVYSRPDLFSSGNQEVPAFSEPGSLLKVLEEQKTRFYQVRERMKIDEISSFAIELKRSCVDIPGSTLAAMADSLLEASMRFDVDKITKIMNDFNRKIQLMEMMKNK